MRKPRIRRRVDTDASRLSGNAGIDFGCVVLYIQK